MDTQRGDTRNCNYIYYSLDASKQANTRFKYKIFDVIRDRFFIPETTEYLRKLHNINEMLRQLI